MELKDYVRSIPDFPKEGILFRDITPLLANKDAFHEMVDRMAEYLRDKNAGLPIEVPKNYYPNDDDTQEPLVTWRSHANLLYANWLNYLVYQTTPYDLKEIRE